MNLTPKTAVAAFLAFTALNLLLLASALPRTTSAQSPDYTAQCSNGIVVPDPQNNPGLVQDCAALLASKDTLDPDGHRLDWSADTPIREWNYVYSESTLEGAYYRNRVVSLRLGNRGLTGSIAPELSNLANLKVLALDVNQLTGSIPPELGNLTNLRGLHLSINQLTGSIPTELGNLSNLTRLEIDDNQLTGSIPPELGNLSNLDRLSLSGNQLTGSIPTELGNLSNLEVLILGINQLTGSIPTELSNLSNLEALFLSNNQLTGSIPTELGNLSNLQLLYLAGNQLTGCIPAALGGVRSHDFSSLGLPICDYTPPSPTPTLTAAPPTQTPVVVVVVTATPGADASAPVSDAPSGGGCNAVGAISALNDVSNLLLMLIPLSIIGGVRWCRKRGK